MGPNKQNQHFAELLRQKVWMANSNVLSQKSGKAVAKLESDRLKSLFRLYRAEKGTINDI